MSVENNGEKIVSHKDRALVFQAVQFLFWICILSRDEKHPTHASSLPISFKKKLVLAVQY